VLGLAASLLAVCLVIAFGLPRAVNERLPESSRAIPRQGFGSEFMPTLEEGSLLFMPVLLPATSLTEVKRIMAWQDKVMSAHPAVASVAGKLGRADHRHRPGPGRDDRDHHHAQAPRPVASRDHQGLHHRRPLGEADEPARLCARLSSSRSRTASS
jgi:hypothetical protein